MNMQLITNSDMIILACRGEEYTSTCTLLFRDHEILKLITDSKDFLITLFIGCTEIIIDSTIHTLYVVYNVHVSLFNHNNTILVMMSYPKHCYRTLTCTTCTRVLIEQRKWTGYVNLIWKWTYFSITYVHKFMQHIQIQ